ncbi:MAG: protein kinase [Actinomycetia bacterium]|nr:protein kinase [Actinomycetes bacterium]MCP5035171.1 protein kinase [Actinomycetes bacterium]
MVDETDNEGERPTPPAPVMSGPRHDQTIKLDLAIANGNLSLPSHFGRYQVLNRIGIGGFASVYSALDPELDSTVAIKVLAENHSANVNVRRRFVTEARVARRLGSDRLIGVFDLGETDDGRPFVVMELAERGTLRQRVVKTGRPSIDDLIRLITELGACMEAVHAQGIVHRDIKPSNLLFRATEYVDEFAPTRLIEDGERLVLADFGLARDISDGASALTVGGGTEGYMAPEQADPRGKADYRADIFSATVVVAEFTTGRHPERLDLTTADISTDMLEMLSVGMAIDRETRPPTAAEWTARLLRAYRSEAATRTANSATGALNSAVDQTELIDPTRVQAPYPYNSLTDDMTDIPETGLGQPVSFVAGPDRIAGGPGSGTDAPAPPPGLPIDPALQPPPPQPPTPEPSPPASSRDLTPPPVGSPQAPGNRRFQPHQPAPGPPPAPDPEPRPRAQPVPASHPTPLTQRALARSTPATQPTPAAPLPRPHTQYQPPSSPPVYQASQQPTTRQPSLAPHQQEARHPGLVAFVEPISREVAAEEATTRSKQHLRTAKKLAKLELKQNRRRARKARRRRRRLRVVNFFLSLIRGVLGAASILLIAAIIAEMATGDLDSNEGAKGAVLVATILGFLWGVAYFPIPRPREI